MTTSPEASERELPQLPKQVGHLHSDGEYCADSKIDRRDSSTGWPVDLFTAEQMQEYARAALRAPKVQAPTTCRQCAAKQAQIDRLMLEYCPDEMTPEQMEEWARNQRPGQESAALLAALSHPLPALAPLQVDNKPQG
jgi:hypothetical protein